MKYFFYLYFLVPVLVTAQPVGAERVEALLTVSDSLIKTDINQAIETLNEAMELAIQENQPLYEIQVHLKLGDAYKTLKRPVEAGKHYTNALHNSRKQDKNDFEITALIGLAQVEDRQGNYDSAIELLLEARGITKLLKKTDREADINATIARVYFNFEQLDKAINYLQLAEDIYIENNELEKLSALYNNLAILHKSNNNPIAAKEAFLQAKETGLMVNDVLGVAFTNNNLGYFSILEGNIAEAETYLSDAFKIFEQYGIEDSVLYTNLCELYIRKGELHIAEAYGKKALALHEQSQIKNELMQNHEVLSRVYEAMKQYETALFHRKAYETLKDEIFVENKEAQIQAIEDRLKVQQQEFDIAMLNRKATRRSYFLLGIGVLFVLTLFIGYLLIKQRQTRIKQDQIALEQKLLRSQMNPHFIFNALTSIQSFIPQNKREQAYEYLTKFARLIRRILENSRKSFISIDEEIQMLTDYLDLQNVRFSNSFIYEVTKEDTVRDDIGIPPMLVQPFVENSVEHGLQHDDTNKGELKIHFKKQDELIVVSIQDNGIWKEKASDQYIDGLKGESLSTKITQERLERFGTLFRRKTKINTVSTTLFKDNSEGTQVELTIPYTHL